MSTDIEYALGVIRKKEIALKSDEIAERAEKLVNNHFNAHPEEKLDSNQINRFTGIAFSSDMPDKLQRFIEKQSGKGRKGWIENGLDKYLLDEIKKIKNEDSKQVYQNVLTRVKEHTEEDIANKFKKKEKEIIRTINIELLKEFATHFGIYYLYRREEDVRKTQK
jgi:metal-responsive CopG/Arc/MetJ family transcriptional regulator